MAEEKTIADIKKEIEDFGKKKVFIFRGENEEYPTIASSLYREQKDNLEELNRQDILENLNFEQIQQEIIKKAKRHFAEGTSDGEILTQLQHYGGKTNLIDFSRNFLIALFFACNGKFDKDGYLICFDKEDLNKKDDDKNFLLESHSKNNRVIFQSSIFVYASKGTLERPETVIPIPYSAKQSLLEELRRYHDIHEDTIYNDLQGFINNSKNYKSAETYFYMGLSYQEKGESKEAIKQYDEAIRLNPNLAETYYNRGLAKYNLEEYENAIDDYDEAIELNPNDAEAYNNRGAAKAGLEQYENAIDDYNKAIELNPNKANTYNNRGLAKYNLEEYEEAIEDYDEAIRLNPSYADAYNNRGSAKDDLEQYEEAIDDYDKAIELNPNLVEAYNNRGFVKANLKQHEEAIEDYEKAIELNPNYSNAYSNRGNVKYNLKQYKEAIKDYDKAIALNPNHTKAHNNRKIALEKLNN